MPFTSDQITELRTRYGAIDKLDPEGAGYRELCRLLDSLPQDDLKVFASADIKWISSLARNRVRP